MMRDRYEVWEPTTARRDFIVRDTTEHRRVWSSSSRDECTRIADLLNEAFRAGQREVAA